MASATNNKRKKQVMIATVAIAAGNAPQKIAACKHH
jgi:hypothetical protein